MKICIAVNFLHELTGSELLAIELANEFSRYGCKVDILAYSLNEDFARAHLDPSINCYSDIESYDFSDADLYYCQHQMGSVIVPFLMECFENGQYFTWPYLIFSHISVNFGFETPGPFAEFLFADEIWCNSEETKQNLIENYGEKFNRASVFYNAAPIEYETVAAEENVDELSRLLVVSNHCASEVVEGLEILESRGVKVLRRGKQFEQKKITIQDLEANQAVLTIGKTVQYALRAKRAVYCYDIHGGPGWLNPTNFDASSFHNFSGRSNPRALEATEIADELMDGYFKAIQFSKSLTQEKMGKYKLEDLVRTTLTKAKNRLKSVKRNSELRITAQDPQVKGNIRQEYNIAYSLMDYSINSVSFLNHLNSLEHQKAKLQSQKDKQKRRIARLVAQLKRLEDKLEMILQD